jgi:hypothetical protein
MEVNNREIDYAIAEYLFDWDKVSVENITDFEGHGWETPEGFLISIDETPRFSTNIEQALVVYSKYKKEIDNLWMEDPFEVNARSLCVASLKINEINL